MKNERSRTNGDGKVVFSPFTGIHESVVMIHPLQTVQQLAPYEVKQLLVQVLQDDDTRCFIQCVLTVGHHLQVVRIMYPTQCVVLLCLSQHNLCVNRCPNDHQCGASSAQWPLMTSLVTGQMWSVYMTRESSLSI